MAETELEKQLRFVKNAIYNKERGLVKTVTVGPGGWELPPKQVGKAIHSLVTVATAVEKVIEENIQLRARIEALENKK